MFTKLLSGVAVAATFTVPQLASAGHCGCPCGRYAPAAVWSQPAVPAQPAATPHHDHATAPPAPAATAQPPVASGQGQVIRRFTYEPGTEPAPQAAVAPAAGPVYQPAAPVYRSAAPAFRSSQATRTGRSAGGLTGEARLHPGRGR